MQDEFVVTLVLLPTSGLTSATLSIVQKNGQTTDLTVSKVDPIAAKTIDFAGNFIVGTAINTGAKQTAIAIDPVSGKWSLHVQVIERSLAAAYVTHTDASSPPVLRCPKDPKRKITCPGSITCTGDDGEQYVLTC